MLKKNSLSSEFGRIKDPAIAELLIRTSTGTVLAFFFLIIYFFVPRGYLIFWGLVGGYIAAIELPRLISNKKALYIIAFFYPAVPIALLMMLEYHYRVANQLLPLVPVVIAVLADTGGYAAGKLWGKHKIAPRISPGKSYEGLAGSFVAVGIFLCAQDAFFVETPWSFFICFSWIARSCIAFYFTLLAFCGGQVISYLKRKQGLKDCGSLIPGHGGMLDRCDGLFFVVTGFWMLRLLFF